MDEILDRLARLALATGICPNLGAEAFCLCPEIRDTCHNRCRFVAGVCK